MYSSNNFSKIQPVIFALSNASWSLFQLEGLKPVWFWSVPQDSCEPQKFELKLRMLLKSGIF